MNFQWLIWRKFGSLASQVSRTCATWRDLRPARDFRHRVTFANLPGWEQYAAQLRRVCPQITVVVVSEGYSDLAQLLRSPECDIVTCFPQGSTIMRQWSLQTGTHIPDSTYRALTELQELAAIVEQAPPLARSHLELSLRTRSNQLILPSVEAAIHGMTSTIREIREQQQFIATSKVLFPLESLRVLAFSLPSRPREPDIFQAAMRLAPNLEFLQLYVKTRNTTVSALCFLAVLAELPNVTSVRLVTKGNTACLSSSYLMHITRLELGCQVYFRQLPPRLRELYLEGLDLDWLGYEAMMSALQQAITPVNLTLTSSVIAAMPCLSANLQKLSLQYLLAVHLCNVESFCTLRTSMARLENLRVLCIADYLTGTTVFFLSGMVSPNLHTLGFCLDSQANGGYFTLDSAGKGASSILGPTFEVKTLRTVFPNLEQMKVSCVGGSYLISPQTRLQVRIVKYDCAWISSTFPKLRGIICNSEHVSVEFVNLSRHIYLTYKI